eukprot:CAMPEP_0183304692 /NCGR_PEP_ID=MMETSP0160_2-20130417/9697_1 /TAXON_ID=2839 ORGANISM="Odontella Sinensis, Strain Grunow 1884" /NCGR_SAMPLE_ID=MMETSP0160_2 /ASSEMBLY_ACC=CAM_ASM_000250 /LENGTH=413 /DNA_ID=CAMNT_0025467789 /DNA_START=36 /DNA_END=1277 /DNA_ORIENTATION=-
MRIHLGPFLAAAAASAAAFSAVSTDAFSSSPTFARPSRAFSTPSSLRAAPADDKASGVEIAQEVPTKAPVFNGKMVFPMKALDAGLKGHKVAAVYAVMNSGYKRGAGDGWDNCEYVGVTRDLDASLRSHVSVRGKDAAAHVRALSFSYPQRSAMEEVASRWRDEAAGAGGKAAEVGKGWEADSEGKDEKLSSSEIEKRALLQELENSYYYDDDEDFDSDDDEDFGGSISLTPEDSPTGNSVVSPFAEGETPSVDNDGPIEFNVEGVNKVLDEVRPYLISDGGNVSVDRVDEETKNVYLKLEGACGSCASSTVTMQMGIERVLKENFPDLGEVIQVEDPEAAEGTPTELTLEAVEAELRRISPAIIAMGGVVEIVSVDPIGVVELRYRGSNKLQQGLELAIRDVPFVKHVKFVS